MEIKGETKELDEVLDLFISSKEQDSKAPWAEQDSVQGREPKKTRALPLAETTRIRKEITCPAGPGAQDRLRGLLFEYLQDDYEITRVEVRKVTQRTEENRKIHQEEEVSLVIKES
ncbi:MAG: hypothetical protein DRG71_07990 [Deltaproteobacteria bacterium]|nr:MAG: hypothetical protein DRG71_07990 [Deltaproteobacteria bacterium]